MSDHSLPENIDQWPRDPYALLGVHHSSSRREVKRAYAQLIRTYKPEHFPEQFRRIRDAYELLDQRLTWTESIAAAKPESDPLEVPADAADGEIIESGDHAAGQTAVEPVGSVSRDRDGLWQKALQGDLAEAYAHYSRLAEQGRGDEELFVRLFWMLKLTPPIDPARDARDWLVAGMKKSGLRGRLPELYRSELVDDPHESLHGRCDQAIRLSGHLGLLTELVIARWGGAAKLQKWEVIAQDMETLRGRLQEESAVWGRLLLAAIDHLAWAKQEEHQQTLLECHEELEQLAEHWLPIEGELNQRDILLELVQACDQLKFLGNLPLEWRKSLRSLLATSWNLPFENIQAQLLDVLAPLVRNPIAGLAWLDRLEAHCRPALHRFGTLIVALASACGVERETSPNAVLLDRLVAFLIAASKNKRSSRWRQWAQSNRRSDQSGRVELLIFCLQECVTVRHLMDLLAGSGRKDLAQFLPPASSAPLHFMCLAYMAFWA